MATESGSGEVEILERMPGTVAFLWYLEIKGNSPWKSPLFWFTDPSSGTKHEWRLTLNDGLVFGTGNSDYRSILMIEYLGKADGKNSTFFIRYRVSSVVANMKEHVHHDDTADEKLFQKFSETKFYTITMSRLPKAPNLKIVCIIVAAQINITEQNMITLPQLEISLGEEYENLFESSKFSDVTFVVGQQEFKLHQNILSSRSSVFAAMFDHNFKENALSEVRIDDQSYEVMKEFFRYVYAAKINDIKKYSNELLALSNKYLVDGLKFRCEQSLVKNLQNENAILNLAHLHNAKNLEFGCLKFIASNAKEIVQLPSFDIHRVPENLRNELFKLVALGS